MTYWTGDVPEGHRCVVYGDGATFDPACPKCGRFVEADKEIKLTQTMEGATATCKKHGRVEMPFVGWH